MAILQSLQRWVGGLLPTRQSNDGTIVKPDVLVGTQWEHFYVGGPAVYPDNNIQTYINLFAENWAVYTIVSLIARKGASIPMYVYKVEDKTASKQYKSLRKMLQPAKQRKLQKKAYGEQVEDNEISKLLNQPNPMQGRDQFIEQLLRYYETVGEVFIWLNRGDAEYNMLDDAALKLPIYEMYIIPAQYVNLIPDPDDVFGIIGYEFQNGGKKELISKYDMIHWKMPQVEFDAYTRVHLRGLSPLKAGLKLAENVDSLTNAQVAMAQNDGAKGIFTQKTAVPPTSTQETDLRNRFDAKVNNSRVLSKVAFISGPADYNYFNFAQSGKDMELNGAQSEAFTRMCNLWGVSPNLFIQGATFDNVKEARKDLITNLECPALESLCYEFNKKLVPAFGYSADTTIDIDISELPEMQNDMGTLVTSLAAAFWLTPNEKRESMNEERSDDPNMDKIYIPSTLTPLDDLNINLDDYAPTGTPSGNSGGQIPNLPNTPPGKR